MKGNFNRPRACAGLLAAGAAFLVACAQNPVPNLHEAKQQVETYIESGRYESDVAAVAASARSWMEKRAPQVERPAIVLDVDETSLSNWPAYEANGWGRVMTGSCDPIAGPCGMLQWFEMGQSKALAPTAALVRRAKELGVAVFFITGRPTRLQAATERNLREQGYEFDRVLLNPQAGKLPSAVQFKAPARCVIEQEGYRIILSLGDQQSDLDGGCTERGFKLPNPVYFIP
jgi:acid phosphatase